MEATVGGALAIVLAWAAFGAVHSLLAREWVKRRAERLLGPAIFAGGYRLLYTLISLALLAGLWLFPLGLAGDLPIAALPQGLWPLPYLVKAAAAGMGLLAFWQIRLGEFVGASQLLRWTRGECRDLPPTPPGALPPDQAPEPLVWGGIYLWARHPLNTATFVWIWAQPAYSLYNVLFAASLTAYILIANRFEERDLLLRYGPAYARYREVVPAFFGGLRGLRERRARLGRALAPEAAPAGSLPGRKG